MAIILRVAGETIFRCPTEHIVLMARAAVQLHMIPDQRERREVVIEPRSRPFGRLVTEPAIPAELPFVRIIHRMTGEALARCAFVDSSDMAGLALCTHVRTGQREGGCVVIEASRLPCIGSMAFLTRASQLSLVCIVLLMAGEAIHRRALEESVHMTLFACHLCVRAT